MSKENQNLDDLFKMAFENHQVTPSAHLWDNIERELPPASDDAVFKNAFANFEVEPSPVVWNNVSRKLPVSLVLRRHLTMLSRVAAVLLVVMFGTFAFEKWIANTSAVEFSTPTAEVKTQNDTQNDAQASSGTFTNDLTPQQTVKATHVKQSTINTILEKSSNRDGSLEIVPETFIRSSNRAEDFEGRGALIQHENTSTTKGKESEKLELKPIMPIAQLDNADLLESRSLIGIGIETLPSSTNEIAVSNALSGFMTELSLEKLAQEEMEKREEGLFRENVMNFQGYYVSLNGQGGYAGVASSTLRNQIGTAAAPAIRLGGLGGLSIGRKFSQKAAVEVGLYFSSQGQRYREILNGGEQITKADLTYFQVPLTLKYRRKELSSQTPISASYVFGLQYGRSVQSPSLTTTLNGEPVTAPIIDNSLFVTNELAAIAGLEWDFYLNNQWSLTAGGRAIVGTDMGQLFADGSSCNVLVGGRLGVNYRFTK